MENNETKKLLIHRDLSWLAFNARVLHEAQDSLNPLLEQLKFLAIFVSNLDEFSMVRAAGLRRLLDVQFNRQDAFGYRADELYKEIYAQRADLIKQCYAIFEKNARPAMEAKGISIKAYADLSDEQAAFVKRYFETTLFPIMTPMAVDEGHPFPILPSKTLAFAMHLEYNAERHLAILPVPRSISRVLKLPTQDGRHEFILIDDIVRQHASVFFKGFELMSCARFRVIRDSELSGSEEYSADLLKAIEDEIRKRPRAQVVYMEIEKGCSEELAQELCQANQFPYEEMTVIKGDFDLTYLFDFIGQVPEPTLLYPSYTPAKTEYENIFDRIKEGDFIVHAPYQSFYPTVDLISSAADDPDVLAIKMTLYRTNQDSAIIAALKRAARNKKQVSVLVEIKARFDEEQNILWARELEMAGCHVMYGILGMKIHSKVAMVVRKEEGRIRRYVHLSTGNYNEKTAKVYTDIGFFTTDHSMTRDVSEVFNVITGYSLPTRWPRIVSAPHDLRPYFIELVDKEIRFHKEYGSGKIFARMNSLEDPTMIHKLYEASQAGVQIRLIVRGICSLKPGVKGLSETIEVRSIVGRFLEHTRIYIFNNNNDSRVFMSSADFMRRNFDRRIELLFEMDGEDLKDELQELMELHWQDNVKSWHMHGDGTYVRPPIKGEAFNVQERLIERYKA